MPLQNRVTPHGDLVAVPERGLFMGNRGRLHDEHRQIRRWADGRRWITCVTEFRGRHRTVMAPGRYTELFFLDEATSFAAGHRPCAECRRADHRRFLGAWPAGGARPRVDEVDRTLDDERREGRRRRTWPRTRDQLPDGAFVDVGGTAHLVLGGALHPWAPGGYGPARPAPTGVLDTLTPPSLLAVLAAGYELVLHPTLAR
jgi:hypothetical protein